jgi:sugar lactone lactonase YvrE
MATKDNLQLHVKRGSDETFRPVKNDMRVKPDGGFWTSAYTPNAEHLSGWVQWCASEKLQRRGKP